MQVKPVWKSEISDISEISRNQKLAEISQKSARNPAYILSLKLELIDKLPVSIMTVCTRLNAVRH